MEAKDKNGTAKNEKGTEVVISKSLHLSEAVHRALEEYDMITFIDILDSCAFPCVGETLRPKQTDEFPSTYRVYSVLKSFEIECEGGNKMIGSDRNDKGDIDLSLIHI